MHEKRYLATGGGGRAVASSVRAVARRRRMRMLAYAYGYRRLARGRRPCSSPITKSNTSYQMILQAICAWSFGTLQVSKGIFISSDGFPKLFLRACTPVNGRWSNFAGSGGTDVRLLGTERRSTKGCPLAELRVTSLCLDSTPSKTPGLAHYYA